MIKIKKYYLNVIFILSFLYALFAKDILTIMVSSRFSLGFKIIPITILSTIFLSENCLFGTILRYAIKVGNSKVKIQSRILLESKRL